MPANHNLYVLDSTARALPSLDARIRSIMQYWQSQIGQVYPFMRHDTRAWLNAGIEDDVITQAIYSTTMAPRPSWQYTRAIMRHLQAEGVTTYDQWCARDIQHRARTRE